MRRPRQYPFPAGEGLTDLQATLLNFEASNFFLMGTTTHFHHGYGPLHGAVNLYVTQ
jgi:hypothetical protein